VTLSGLGAGSEGDERPPQPQLEGPGLSSFLNYAGRPLASAFASPPEPECAQAGKPTARLLAAPGQRGNSNVGKYRRPVGGRRSRCQCCTGTQGVRRSQCCHWDLQPELRISTAGHWGLA
jgi:hypothetical protein